MFTARFDQQLQTHHQANLIRQRHARHTDDQILCFCHNDYLGFSQHPDVIKATQQALSHYGIGSTGSAHITGYTDLHQQLEQDFAETLGFERAVLFGNGYLANLAVLSTLAQKGDYLLQDKLCHASLLEGGTLSPATRHRYPHLNTNDLDRLLKQTDQPSLIATDMVFSMDGDIAPLPKLTELAKQYNSLLITDDAHGLGVLGHQGLGSYQHFDITPEANHIGVYPLGKAMGSYGALVCSSQQIIDVLLQFARPYFYNTALPPALAAASLASLHLLKSAPQYHQALQDNIAYFRAQATTYNLPITNSHTAIQPLIIGDPSAALAISTELKQHQIHVSAIRPPTVPANSSRLRITLSSRHQHADIDRLLETLSTAIKQQGH